MKAIIPAIGLDPRFLPLVKAIPKEMLPLGDKPAIHYVVEEAVAAGFDEILIVLDGGKESIRSYFEPDLALEERLEAAGEEVGLAAVRQAVSMARVQFAEMKEGGGVGEAILLAKEFVGDDSWFAVLLGDTVMRLGSPLSHMVEAWKSFGKSSVSIESCQPYRVSEHTIAGGREIAIGIFEILQVAEKPEMGNAPELISQKGSRLPFHAVASRYLFAREVLECLGGMGEEVEGDAKMPKLLDSLRERSGLLGITWFGERLQIDSPESFMEAARAFCLGGTGGFGD